MMRKFKLISGIGTMIVVLAVTLRWPQLLRLGQLHKVTEKPEGPVSSAEAKGETEIASG